MLYRQPGRTQRNGLKTKQDLDERVGGIDCLILAFTETVVLSYVKRALCTGRKQQGGRILVDVERESVRAAVDRHLRLKPIPPLFSFHFDKSHLYASSNRALVGQSGISELLFTQSSIFESPTSSHLFVCDLLSTRSSLLRDTAR